TDPRRDRQGDGCRRGEGPRDPEGLAGARVAPHADRRGGGFPARRLHRGRRPRGPGRRRQLHPAPGAARGRAPHAVRAGEEGDPAPVRPRRWAPTNARRSGQGVRGHARADPSDREQDTLEVAPPLPVTEAARLPRVELSADRVTRINPTSTRADAEAWSVPPGSLTGVVGLPSGGT